MTPDIPGLCHGTRSHAGLFRDANGLLMNDHTIECMFMQKVMR
jgi:hypothetical protein